MTTITELNPAGLRIVLVFQGGGALGAYQAGVYQALHEHGLVPDWIVGTSIGAINAAILAGNTPALRLDRLKQFWDRVAQHDNIDLASVSDQQRRAAIWLSTFGTVAQGIPGFFRPRLPSGFPFGLAVEPEQASYYDTGDLARTLDELVDFDYLNAAGGMRLTVNALKVTCGELANFDSARQTISADHVRASGALPPGFSPVRIDGALYWDGGLYSNTPLSTVLDDAPHVDTLCFMVDLWSAEGPEPGTLDEVQTRQKDVMFASRSKRQIADYVSLHKMQAKLRELYALLPESEKNEERDAQLRELGCGTTMHIVRLPYAGRDWHMAAKDINFSKGSIDWRWEQGYQDALRAITAADWRTFVTEDTALVMHELPLPDVV
jgi:NTE family protein